MNGDNTASHFLKLGSHRIDKRLTYLSIKCIKQDKL